MFIDFHIERTMGDGHVPLPCFLREEWNQRTPEVPAPPAPHVGAKFSPPGGVATKSAPPLPPGLWPKKAA